MPSPRSRCAAQPAGEHRPGADDSIAAVRRAAASGAGLCRLTNPTSCHGMLRTCAKSEWTRPASGGAAKIRSRSGGLDRGTRVHPAAKACSRPADTRRSEDSDVRLAGCAAPRSHVPVRLTSRAAWRCREQGPSKRRDHAIAAGIAGAPPFPLDTPVRGAGYSPQSKGAVRALGELAWVVGWVRPGVVGWPAFRSSRGRQEREYETSRPQMHRLCDRFSPNSARG